MANCNSEKTQVSQKFPSLISIIFHLINLNHFMVAISVARQRLEDNSIHIALLEDAYCSRRRIVFNFLTAWKIFSSKQRTALRTLWSRIKTKLLIIFLQKIIAYLYSQFWWNDSSLLVQTM